jgi:hypothetical protein
LKSLDDVARVFDALLCSHPLFCYYVCAAYIVHLKPHIVQSEPDNAVLHNLLVNAPDTNGFPFEHLLPLADDLFRRFPPHKLAAKCDDELRQLIREERIDCLLRSKFPAAPFPVGSDDDADAALLELVGLRRTPMASLRTFGARCICNIRHQRGKNPLFWPTVAMMGGLFTYCLLVPPPPH